VIPFAVAELTVLALAASTLLGAGGTALLYFIVRRGLFKRNAAARFTLWLTLLMSLACAGPAFFLSGEARLNQVPIVSVSRLAGPALRPRPAPEPQHVDPAMLAVALWLGGVCVSLARVGIGVIRLSQIVAASEEIDVRATARGRVRVLVSDHFAVPVAIGYRRPSILVPRALRTAGQDADFENVVLHELEHLRRFDDLTSLAQAVCMSALWFNPFAYAIARHISVEREMACDEAVVVRTGRRAAYAATLWRIAIGTSDAAAPAVIPAFSSGAHTAPRLDNLLTLRGGVPMPRRSFAAALCVVLPAAFLSAATVTPAMTLAPSPLTSYASVALPCGEALVVGGRRADGSAVDEAQLYDVRGRRIGIISMPLGVWSATATRLRDGNVLVTGGVTTNGVTAASELYNVEHHAFEAVAPMNAPRVGQTATLYGNGSVVIAGGEVGASPAAPIEVYSPKTRRFSL
jgi:beta-lactamase regulating signal transducer with metallopeptidase domain